MLTPRGVEKKIKFGGGKKKKKIKRKASSSNKDSQLLKYFLVFLVVRQVSLGCVNELVPGKFWHSCCL